MNYDTCEQEYMELKSQFETERRFERFVDEFNDRVIEILGLSVDDFPDFDFYSVYQEDVEPDSKEWRNMLHATWEYYFGEIANSF